MIENPDAGPEAEVAPSPDPQAAAPAGASVIAAYLPHLPLSPGVYRMLDAQGEVLYVGKAINLRARVSAYARAAGHAARIERMIAATAAMEFVTVATEAEALLLEANLIKRFRPPFNVIMRDDKSFPYILISDDHDAPQLSKHRGARKRKGQYFGPFANAGAVNRTINTLQRAFLLRTCTDSIYASRTRPCLLHQIKRCSAPCTGEIEANGYRQLAAEAARFLKGESSGVRKMYQDMMQEASDALEYERAASYRNRLRALAYVTADQAINPNGIEEADIFALAFEGGQACIQVFFFRAGQNWGNRAIFPKVGAELAAAEVLETAISQFYDDTPVPRLVLLSEEVPDRALLAEALTTKAGKRVLVRVPVRGRKAQLVGHALANARQALGRRIAEAASQRALLQGMADRFGLKAPPARIEVYDNSHVSGTHAVGAMIVAGDEGFIKKEYRKFNIVAGDGLEPGDDYAMMRQMLTRRFKRLAVDPAKAGEGESKSCQDVQGSPVLGSAPSPQEDAATAVDRAAAPWPDVVLVDGGPGQLSIARAVLAEFGLGGIALIGVAKGPDRDAGREHFHIDGRAPFMLEPRDPVLYFLQRLRDEAHRFAILTHRAKRSKAISANPLDEIGGIGPTRKRALLTHFGSAKAVSRAGVEDLKCVGGISAELAQKIYDYFNDGGSRPT